MPDSNNNEQNPQETETGKYILVNAYEGTVRENVKDLMSKEPDMCHCEKCYLDICALVLNSERANYNKFVTTHKGELFSRLPQIGYANKTEMTVIILDAIRMVKESPKHEE